MEQPRDEQTQDERDKPGYGVDRTLIWRLLDLTPAQRVKMLVVEARNLAALDLKLRRR